MRFDDRPRDRKFHAKTVGFGAEEGIEDALCDLRIEARAGVFDRDLGIVRRSAGNGDAQLPPAVGECGHGLNAVHGKVQQHLLQLDLVAQQKAA
jgi:hypothetical protein